MIRPLWVILAFLVISCSKPTVDRTEGDAEALPSRIQVQSTEEARDFYHWTPDRMPLVSAHRGGPYPGYPENSIEAFEHVIRHTPAIIEFDVALTEDSVLVLMHDNTLDRTTTGKGRVIDHTYAEIKELFLVDKEDKVTEFKVPTLDEALVWGKDKALFTVDIKREVPFEMVVEAIQRNQSAPYAAVITYSVAAAQKMHRLDPSLMLSVTIRNEEELERMEKSGIPIDRWIAFTGTSLRPENFNRMLQDRGVFTILGVIGNLDRSAQARGDQLYVGWVKTGADILATDRPIEAAQAIKELIPENSSKRKYFKP